MEARGYSRDIAEKFPELIKKKKSQIQKAKIYTSQDKQKKSTPRHIAVKRVDKNRQEEDTKIIHLEKNQKGKQTDTDL